MRSSGADYTHLTVMRDEVVDLIDESSDGVVIDATLGLGGHSEAILSETRLSVVGIDQDSRALEMASERLADLGERFRAVKANFESIKEVVSGISQPVRAIVADLGVSSMQLDDGERGFSFRFDAPLDMRMNTETGRTAAELLADEDEETVANIIYQYGEERKSRRIARYIAERNRAGNPVRTTLDLARLVERAVGKKPGDKIHPATRTFQALRIAVNRELEILEGFLLDSIDALERNGVLAVITFHSLEDRIVKHLFQRAAGKCICPPRIPQCICGAEKIAEIITRKPIVPSEEEQNANPRSRSAKLRAVRKLNDRSQEQ